MNLCDINEIKFLLAEHGFRFSKSMGQNFLTEQWVPERFISEAGIGKDCGILEIGPGIGCLTKSLSKHAGKIVSVELDAKLLPVLSETLKDCDNVKIIHDDILKTDIRKIVSENFEGLTPAVCANLPYNITGPVLSLLIKTGCFEQITVMIQKEVAERICAKPRTPDYGAFTLFINYYAEPCILFDVPPTCFIPRPKVTSSVITMRRRTVPCVVCDDEKLFFSVIKASFAQRRKVLANALHSAYGTSLTKDELHSVLAECGFSPSVRGEELSISDFAKLSNNLAKRINS